MGKSILFLCCWFSTMAATAQRQHRSLDDGWRFHFGDASDPAKDFNYGTVSIFSKSGKSEGTAIAPDFNDRDWRALSVPHDWAVELPFENSPDFDVMSHGYKPVGGHYPATSIGWYRKRFVVAAADSGQRFVLQFDGIFRDSKVWVNGFYCCSNASGYSGFSVDVTDFIRYGRENVLVVRVDASQYEGWFYEGAGIYRHVWLNSYSPVHIAEDGLFVYSAMTGSHGGAMVTVETTVKNDGQVAATADVAVYVTNREGMWPTGGPSQIVKLAPGESKVVADSVFIAQPILWSVERPYLYRTEAVIRLGGKVVDEEKIRVGIRTIRIDSTGLYVNGLYTKIKGVCNHQDHAGVGSAMPDYLQYYRARLLKQMGVNAVRTSHNPPTPELLDACDSLGLLVLDENRLLNSGPEYLDQFRRLIFRDRSRASVFLWSLGNEEGYVQTRPVGREIALTMMARLKEWDPTRICTYAADVANVYQGINQVIPVRGFNYRIMGVDPYHKDHPGQPILGSEMGSTVTTRGIYAKDTVRCYVPDEDITAPWWANTAEQWWPLAADRSWWMGGFVWTGFDYRGEPTPYKWPNISSHFGVMDVCGFPKNIYYYYQSWWTDDDVLHISPHWNWKGKEGQSIPVWVNSNADQVELLLNGKSLGKKDMPRNSHLEWSVPYEAGKLEAVATKKGKRFTASVETTSDPFEVVVTPYKTTILADGKDATVLNISVVDRQGREVPDAGNAIRFVATGDLHIIGVGNGDPSSHEADKGEDSAAERHLFNGHAQVIVKAGVKAGVYHFTASAEGLHQGATDISTIVPGVPHSVLGWKPVGDNGNDLERSTTVKRMEDGQTVMTMSTHVVRVADGMMGADISFLPELEARGVKFSDDKGERDAIQILKDHGFNYIRLRIFNNPARDSGYSPGKGFCDLTHTMAMAKRVKAAGMRFLLDFHYSDTWADPGKQFKPAAWRGEDFPHLQQSVFDYTKMVMDSLKAQGTLPDLVQVGNEINHGMIWPEGSIRHPDSLAALIYAGIRGVKNGDPVCPIMLHIALGGQNDESHFFLDQMLERQVPFDVIGLSYYPKWHGSLADLKYNVDDLARQYDRDVYVVEYTQRKQEVNDIAFSVPGRLGKGACIWEPLNTWERIFEKDGKANSLLYLYDELSKEFVRR
ncbi:MAG TPA: beta-galactosidase GalA [Puia sp.]|jgi:beta-galactosidase|nr:beta-galactosidase GalA [Puia sp.]